MLVRGHGKAQADKQIEPEAVGAAEYLMREHGVLNQ